MEPFNEEIGSHHSWGLVLAVVMLTAGVIALAVTTTQFANQRNEARRELVQDRALVNQLNARALEGPQVQTNSWLYPMVSKGNSWAAITFFEGRAGNSAYVSFAVVRRGFMPNTEYEVEIGGCQAGQAVFTGNNNLASSIADSEGTLYALGDEVDMSDSMTHPGTILRVRSKDGKVVGLLRSPFSRALVLSPSAPLCS
jgi:hypothetical protein